MEDKKSLPATQQPLTQQHIMAHHVHPDQIYAQQNTQIATHITNQPGQLQPNGVMHQLMQNQYHSNMNARSPLLENRHEVYGTGHNHDYNKHYGANDNYNYPQSPPRFERTEFHTDQNVNHELLHNIPKGYNAEVYQDYLKRNPPKDSNQIYQNHQPMYRPNVNQYGSKPYLPYSNRIGPQSNTELLRRQYNEIQQMKMQQQMHYQNQAQMHQQQKFAERQLLLQQIHGVQPPPNLQNSIYSDSSYRDLDRYSSKNDFKEYSNADIHKEVDRYAKDNEFVELEKHNRQLQEAQWQSNQASEFQREPNRYRNQHEEISKHQPSPSEYNNQPKKNNTDMISPMKSSESSTPSVKSPSSESRRSSSGTQALRSPVAQRVPSAPVTMSGILYKQGSDGLKVWRKRWFVLSEYCLFYYKSQEEEKLLGSVLLPSYKVSACTAEDKVMRKFAFKLEHANMRTYVLAALDQESMLKWVKTLTMAALMQNTNDQRQYQSDDRTATKTEDDEETPGPTYANAPPKPRRSNDGYSSPSPDMYDPNYDLLKKPASHYSQGPNYTRYQDTQQESTYTSSPQTTSQQQQIKRPYDMHLSLPLTNISTEKLENHQITSSSYKNNAVSPYTDNRPRNQRDSQHDDKIEVYEKQSQYNPFLQDYSAQTTPKESNIQDATPGDDRNKTTYNENYSGYRSNPLPYEPKDYARDVYGELNKTNKPTNVSSTNDRTDTYGRTAPMPGYSKTKLGDYEDIYAEYGTESKYGKTYDKSPKVPQHRDNLSISSHKTPQEQHVNYHQEKVFSGPSVLRRKKMQASGIQPQMPRPHSADFLEYETKNENMNRVTPAKAVPDPPRQPQRPKSSLDINSYYDPSSDRYYSEESYAEKMRKSAQYLQQQGMSSGNIQIPLAKYASGLAEKQLHSPYSQTPNNNYETGFSLNRGNKDNISYNSKYSDLEGINSNWTLKEKDLENQKLRSGSVVSDNSLGGGVKEINALETNADGFIRSASARIPSSTEREGEKKIQQREESMKRLLEWKQRMLQSPLTRKSTPATISLARSLNQSRQSLRSDNYKSKTYTNASYNSYSSDDEEETSDTGLQIPKDMQAGRSHLVNVMIPTISRPIVTPPTLTSTTDNADPTNDNLNKDGAENIYENILCTLPIPQLNLDACSDETKINVEENIDLSTKAIEENISKSEDADEDDGHDGYETHDSEAESETQYEYTDNDLDEVLLASDIDSERQSDYYEINNMEEVLDKIEHTQDAKSETPPVFTLGEDHYLPMSPRKISMIEPAHKILLENLTEFETFNPQAYEDNPYVEMNLGNEEDDMQTYELVCVNNGKAEPVYMELSNVVSEENKTSESIKSINLSDTASNFADTKEQTLKRNDKNLKDKTNSSDVDEDLSRDVSLDSPFSRMSISDTFRPASYYLSGSRNTLDGQSSFDNDITTVLPAPNSSSPCDVLMDEELSKYILDKLDKSDLSQDNSILKMLTCENQKMHKIKKKTTSLMIYGSHTSIHDTLSRGEKIRNSRASLTNARNKITDSVTDFLNDSIPEVHNSSSVDEESVQSYNADRGSSRLSLESDASSRFENASCNLSSEVRSFADIDLNTLELRHPHRMYIDNIIKRRPLSDDSLFTLPLGQNKVEEISDVHLDAYLESLQPGTSQSNFTNNSRSSLNRINTSQQNAMEPHCHIDNQNHYSLGIPICENETITIPSCTSENRNSVNTQFHHSLKENIDQSISSEEVTNSPLSFYSKSYSEDSMHRKNLNHDVVADKIKEFENEKIVFKTGIDTNDSSTTTGFHSRESSGQSAPYYYSDLSSQEHINAIHVPQYLKNTNLHRKLNNQRRRGPTHKKNEISHIQNPIHNYHLSDSSIDLVASARSVSVEFLSAVEKNPEIDLKNIYESSGGKISKIPESINLIPSLGCKKNSKYINIDESGVSNSITLNAQSPHTSAAVKVSRGSMSSHCSENSSNTVYYDAEAEASAYENIMFQGENHWDENTLWRDNLRRVSHRHARSMDDLDSVENTRHSASTSMNSIKRIKNNSNKISRNVTYVNCDIQEQVQRRLESNTKQDSGENVQNDEDDVYVSLANDSEIAHEPTDEGVYEQLAVGTSEYMHTLRNSSSRSKSKQKNRRQFEFDRENLRQWDLLSSGLMKGGFERVRSVIGNSDMDPNAAVSSMNNGIENANNEASMTMSGTNVESGTNINNSNQQTLSKKAFLGSNTSIGRSNRDGNIPVRAVSPRVRWVEEKPSNEHYNSQQITASQHDLTQLSTTEGSWAISRSPSRIIQQPIRAVSPRVRINTDNEELHKKSGVEQLYEIPTAGELLGRSHEELVLLLIQLRRRHAATHRSIEQCCAQIRSIEDCISSLKAAEREESIQKLEQLKMQLMDLENQYEKSKPLVQLVDNMVKLGSLYNRPGSTIERLERNQRLRQKVLAEHAMEQQRWLESAAAGKPLETEAARVRVAELWALEQELADEAAMIQGIRTDKTTIDTLLTGVRTKLDTVGISEKTQPTSTGLEAELARVHAMLAHNSKKLEQTVADNARLERELQQLRRALRARRARPPPPHPTHPAHPAQGHPTAMLEDEVTRVQQLVSALQRQRQELSRAVRHLTQQSHALQTTHDAMPDKRRSLSSWQETNLDTGHTIDHGYLEYDYMPGQAGQYQQTNVNTPLYVDTRAPGADVTSPLNSEDMHHTVFGNLSNVEKQEIKTVRIVKRESERRQRDRERSLQPMSDWSSNITANLDQFLEEELVQPINNYRSSSVPRTDYGKFEEYYSKGQTDTQTYNRNDRNMEQSPKYPSSPSLSNYDYSKDISSLSSSYHKSYDRSGYDRTMSISTQYLNSPTDSSRTLTNDPMSKTSSVVSLTRSHMELSPIFKSEAAKQIITEMSGDAPKNGSLHRRQVPKEKRRHYTAPHHLSAKTLNELPKDVYNQELNVRSLDDADMELVVRGAAPDVVRSACGTRTIAVPDSIDRLLAAPQKILIPERYIPEKPPELSPEEQQKRQEKVESIKKMLTGTSADPNKSPDGEEKRQREHLLQMNQILAKQVTEMSKIIAVKALEELPLRENTDDYEDRSPDVELPIYQQRENFFT